MMRLPLGLNFVIFLWLFSIAHSQQPNYHQQRHHTRKVQQLTKQKRLYAMCPPSFTKIGEECYYLSSAKANWLDGHFECKDKNSKLAEPVKDADRLLRKYLMERGRTRGEIWIGGMYNWQRLKWQWGYNGNDMTYQSFSQMKPGNSKKLEHNCAVMNPDLKYRWSARMCIEKHFYLCQHRMPYVSERSRQRIYDKWNQTFPGGYANEIQVYVTTNGSEGNRREYYRTTSKRPARPVAESNQIVSQSQNRYTQASNQVPSVSRRNGISNEINPAEVPSPSQGTLKRNKKQHNGRSKERSLVLTGNVDLGTKDTFKTKSRRKNAIKRINNTRPATTTSTEAPINAIPQYLEQNHHRHNHYENMNRYQYDPLTTDSSNHVTVRRTTAVTKLFQPLSSTTTQKPFVMIQNSTKIEILRQAEKKARYDRVKAKLANLTEEQKLEYMRLKAQRQAERKNKSINDTIP